MFRRALMAAMAHIFLASFLFLASPVKLWPSTVTVTV